MLEVVRFLALGGDGGYGRSIRLEDLAPETCSVTYQPVTFYKLYLSCSYLK